MRAGRRFRAVSEANPVPVLVFDRTLGTVRSRGGWKGNAEGRSILPAIPDARSSKRLAPIADLP